MNITPLIAIGIPTYGRITMKWSNARHSIALPLGTSSMTITLDDSGDIAAKRNLICKEALEKGADYIFMLGDDVIIPGNAVLQMLSRKKDLCTGVYWTKNNPTHPYIWKGLQRGPYMDWKAGEFFEVDFAGCDCLLIKTEILRQIPYPWFSIDWVWSDQQKAPSGLETEDFHFYLKAAKAGFNLWCDSSIQCLHEDRESGMMFGLSQDMQQAGSEKERKYKGKLIADLGCGVDVPYFDYECTIDRYDISDKVKPTYRCDLRQLPVEDEKYDVVYSQHVLEHFGRYEMQAILKEWLRILKVGGEFIVKVPNLEFALKNILDQKSTHYEWWQIYGGQSGDYDFHKVGFTVAKLKKLLELNDCLSDIVVEAKDENIEAHATKKKNTDIFVLTDWWNDIHKEKPYYEKMKELYE